MTNTIYLHDNRDQLVYPILADILRKDYGINGLPPAPICGKMGIPEEPDNGFVFINNPNSLSQLEKVICEDKKDFLENIHLTSCDGCTRDMKKGLGFNPIYAIAFYTYSDTEPEAMKNGSFVYGLAKKLQERIKCNYGIVLMNDSNKSIWSYIKGENIHFDISLED